MREVLAERLLAKVMNWSAEDIDRERPDLQALASFKYDEYQQFSPGMRFIESLAIWLSQFKSIEEREQAYKFVRTHLIFISEAEMVHLVSIAFSDFIRPLLVRRTAKQLDLSDIHVKRIVNSLDFKILLRKSLFLGLSDGARIGIFRRSNPQISHEQVRLSYEIPQERVENLIDELGADLERLFNRKLIDDEKKFSVIFLLDDFSGSGQSFLRKKPDGNYSGKIAKTLQAIYSEKGSLKELVDTENLEICIVLYIATTRALSYLRQITEDWVKDKNVNFSYKILAVQEIPNEVCVQWEKDKEFIELLQEYLDESIQDKHYEIGRHERLYLGFDECALPLILSHNTPNNSLPLLWYGENKKYKGLFPRVTRHK